MRLLIAVSFIIVTVISHGQDTLSTSWNSINCSSSFLDHSMDVCTDSKGNIYTLGLLAVTVNINGQSYSQDSGQYFVTKQDPLGNFIWVENLGGDKGFTDGQIVVNSNDELILGLNFESNCYLNGDTIYYAPDFTRTSVLMKLDSNFIPLWSNFYPGSAQNFITHMIVDDLDNIYCTLMFIDSINFQSSILVQPSPSTYGMAVFKTSDAGGQIWNRHIYSDYTLDVKSLAVNPSSLGNPELMIGLYNSGDTIFDEGAIELTHSGYGSVLLRCGVTGSVIQSQFYGNVATIIGIEFNNSRTFIAGKYRDTIHWTGQTTIAPAGYSLFIAQVDPNLDMVCVSDLNSTQSANMTWFDVSDEMGFIVVGQFSEQMTIGSSSVVLSNSWDDGSFVAQFDQNYELEDAKYIYGGSNGIRKILVESNEIIGSGWFGDTSYFQNASIQSWGRDVFTFKTSDFLSLTSFIPTCPAVSTEESGQLLYLNSFPNPSSGSFSIDYQSSIKIEKLIVTDIVGNIVKSVNLNSKEGRASLDLSNQNSGIYFCSLVSGSRKLASVKLVLAK
ncbi:MAG: hypothetical protein ACI9J3_001461 [Parvicellaceae bacterium]|jgi:hypothetical protein